MTVRFINSFSADCIQRNTISLFQPFSLPGRFQGVKRAFVHSSFFASVHSVTYETSYQDWISHNWNALCVLQSWTEIMRMLRVCLPFFHPTGKFPLCINAIPTIYKTIKSSWHIKYGMQLIQLSHNVTYNYLKRLQPELAQLDGKGLKELQVCWLFSLAFLQDTAVNLMRGLCLDSIFFFTRHFHTLT